MSPRELPPNTPDRPAPLNVRSRESSGKLSAPSRGKLAAPTTALFRSASTPIRPRHCARFPNVPADVLEATTELARLAHEAEGGETDSQLVRHRIYLRKASFLPILRLESLQLTLHPPLAK
jgi:hypothetical protein